MSAVLKADPNMGTGVAVQEQWMLVTLTAGIGGSLISFGSAAGVGVMGKLHGIFSFRFTFWNYWFGLVACWIFSLFFY